MINPTLITTRPVKTALDDFCLLEGDGPSPELYAFLQAGLDDDPGPVVATQPDPTTPWHEQATADRDALLARYMVLRPLAANHSYIPDDEDGAWGACVNCDGWGDERHGPLLTDSQDEELDALTLLLGVLDDPYLDDLGVEPDSPADWLVLRESLVGDCARAHDLPVDVVRDRAEHTLDYRGVQFVVLREAMLQDGIRQGRHAGHEVEHVEEETTSYCRQVVRVVDGFLHLAEEVTTEDGVPYPAYLYCATCDEKVSPHEIGASDVPGLE